MINKTVKTVSFISYKGGVGRSLALVNVAYALAELDRRVGCIDLDLDAPGLALIFSVKPTDDSLTSGSIMASGRVASLEDALIHIPNVAKGSIHLLPAKHQPEVVGNISWSPARAINILQSVTSRLSTKTGADIILLDIKAGLGPTSGLALATADLLVCVFRIDKQGLEGVRWISKVFRANAKRAIFVPSMVPRTKAANDRLQMVNKDLAATHVIPYDPAMLIDEKVAVRDSPRSKQAESYRRLAKDILKSIA